jgi:hypothetical protein
MYLDSTNLFSDDQAITGDAASTNVIDLGADFDLGKGEPVKLLIQVTEDFDNLTSLNAKIQTDDNSAFSSPTDLAESGDIALASLKVGYVFSINFMPRGNQRYIRVYYDVTGTAPTAGKITAGIVADHQTNV